MCDLELVKVYTLILSPDLAQLLTISPLLYKKNHNPEKYKLSLSYVFRVHPVLGNYDVRY